MPFTNTMAWERNVLWRQTNLPLSLLIVLKWTVSKTSKVCLRPRQITATSHPHPPILLSDTLSHSVVVSVYPHFVCTWSGSAVQYFRKSHILIIWALTVTVTLKIENQSFCVTVQLVMMYRHARFACKTFSHSEDTLWTNIYWNFHHCSDFDLEHSNPVVSQDILAQADLPSIVFCENISSSEDIVERVIFR